MHDQHAGTRSRRSSLAAVMLTGTAALTVLGVAVPALSAAASTAAAATRVYVSPLAAKGAKDLNCSSAAYKTIDAGVAAVRAGGTVVVCAGTYHEMVAVTKSLSLAGQSHAVVDAAGQDNGVLVAASRVSVTGLTVTGATGEGILVTKASHVTIKRNVVTDNDRGGQPPVVKNKYAECQATDGVPGDCGEGIHLMGVTDSLVADNVSTGNTGGILLSDETGPTAHNVITGNVVSDNLYDCGITITGHNPAAAPGGKPAPKVAGTYDNIISGNTVIGDGTKGDGGGVLLATPFPGGAVYGNIIEGNTILGNGLAGVTVHSHAPGQDLNGNVITDNVIGTNNLDGDSDFAPAVDKSTTGILVATVAPLSITITNNTIADNHYGIWTTGPVAQHTAANNFVADTVSIAKS